MDGLFVDVAADPVAADGGSANDFGRSRLLQQRPKVQQMDVAVAPADVRRALRENCPLLPGVYGMADAQGELVYVGMSGRLRDRLLTYFTKGPPEAKEQRVAARAVHLRWEVRDHELLAGLRELELIRQWRPRFNSVGRPGRRELGFLYLTHTAAPNFRFSARLPRRVRRWWGPLPLNRRMRGTIRHLNHLFLLRDCPDRTRVQFSEQPSMLPDDCHPICLRGDVGSCLAPCAGDRARTDYMQGVNHAIAFLDGRSNAIIERYEAAMLESAAHQRYERAATYRDTWQSLCVVRDQLHLLRHARGDYAGVHELRGGSGKRWWMLVASGHVVWVARRPASQRAARAYLDKIDAALGGPARVEQDDYEQMRIIVSWHRQHPDQVNSIMTADQARNICQNMCTSMVSQKSKKFKRPAGSEAR